MTIIISYSEVFKWQTCQKQYYYRHILGYQPLDQSDPIDIGVKGHKLLENFYRYLAEGHPKEKALELVTHKAGVLLRDSGADFNMLKAWTLVQNYVKTTDFTAEAILIENRFLVPASMFDDDPILNDVQIGFTPDLVLTRKGGFTDVEDYKFVGRAWSAKKKNRYSQTKLYQIFLESMGYNISRTVLRFFNVGKDGGDITAKNYPLTEAAKKILIEDFMAGVKEVIRYKKSLPVIAPRTMNYTACQFCQYEFPCTLEAEGKDASRIFKAEYEQSTYDYNS